MSEILLHKKLNSVGNECMWASTTIEHLTCIKNRKNSRADRGIWVSSSFSFDKSMFSRITCNESSPPSGTVSTKYMMFLTHEEVKKYLFHYNGDFYIDNFEMSKTSYEKAKEFSYLDSYGLKCKAQIVQCDNYNKVRSMKYAILLVTSKSIKITDTLYMFDGKTIKTVKFDFSKPSVNTKYITIDDSEFNLSISSNSFIISPLGNLNYKSNVNTIKYLGESSSSSNQEKSIAMIIQIK